MTGTGFTVERGRTPEPFDVEVLGVLPDGIAPGRDLIVVQVDSPTLQRVRGIWAGMSGSPVYVDGRLLGAIAYGFSFGPSLIGGVTPAEDMLDVLELPNEDEDEVARQGETPWSGASADKVELPRAMRERIARRQGIRTEQVAAQMDRLHLPLVISGAPARAVDAFRERVEDEGLRLVPVAGGAAAGRQQDAPARPQPGGNFAGALSYGDVQAAGVGTTTYVCGDRALGFGHPFFFSGATRIGANDATALAVIDDPTLTPFKMATLGELFGTVDQDRLAAIGATLGLIPETIPVTSTVTAEDTGRSRDGRTDIVFDEILPDLALFHLIANIDSVFDQIGEGSAEATFRASGVTEDGDRFTLQRSNRYSNPFDIAFDPALDLLSQLYALQFNEIAEVEFTGVDIDLELSPEQRSYTFASIAVSTDGGATFAPLEDPEDFIEAEGGDVLIVEIVLESFRDRTPPRTVQLELDVPEGALGGFLTISGGTGQGQSFECLFDPSFCGLPEDEEPETIDDLVAQLEDAPRNDEVVARLETFSDEGVIVEEGSSSSVVVVEGSQPFQEPAPEPTSSPAPGDGDGDGAIDEPQIVIARERVDQVVNDFAGFQLVVPQPTVERVAGEGRIETSLAVSQADRDEAPAVVLARADDYADALAAGPLAASLGAPVLLTHNDGLHPLVAEEIERLGATSVVVLGGQAALSSAVEEAAAAVPGVESVERVSGPTRFATAAEVAGRLGGEGPVYVAQGAAEDPARGWPDAVAVSGLAALQQRPILLVESDRLPDETAAAIPEDFETIIVGGTAAVSTEVEAEMAAIAAERAGSVRRLAGATRYETSAAIAQESLAVGADPGEVVVVTGRSFPDALAAGPMAALRGGTLLLVDSEDLNASPPARAFLEQVAPEQGRVTIVGGFSAVSGFVEQQIFEVLFGIPPCPPEECGPFPTEPDGGTGGEGVAPGEPSPDDPPTEPAPTEEPTPQPTDAPTEQPTPAPEPSPEPSGSPTPTEEPSPAG